MVRWLIANGAKDVNVRDFKKQTPLDVAVENGHKAIAALLREAGGTTGR